MKVKGEFKLPGFLKSALITREFEVDVNKYKKAKDKRHFLNLSFAHHIAEELEVNCVVLK